jgi:cytochrome c553
MRLSPLLIAALIALPAAADEAQREFFENEVRPVLAEHCFKCHGPEKQKASLRLDHSSFIETGGDTGSPVVPGDMAGSRLIEAISYDNVSFQMPPKGKLPEKAIDALKTWVETGAWWPDEPVPEGGGAVEDFDLVARKEQHWAWQPVANPEPPAVEKADWPRDPADNFILARLEEEGYTPAREADRRTLIRRLSFDLTGLPPTPEDVDAFVSDTRPDAYARLVDKLLASPRFGERWGRHWLDLTRYADTYGHEQDFPIANAFRYRDYVIRALNDDVPYDQLVTEHLAGDLMPEPRRNAETGRNESILGTGFLYMHQATHAPVDVRADQADRIDNQIDVISKSFLGMTVSCARCHDHKFDAISAEDYFAMAGFMRSTRELQAYVDPDGGQFEEAEEVRALQPRGTRILKQALTDAAKTAATDPLAIGPYLAGTRSVWNTLTDQYGEEAPKHLHGDGGRGSAKAVANTFNLDPARLHRWTTAALSQETGNTDHPLHAWRAALSKGVDTLQDTSGEELPGEVFADFNAPDALKGWTAHGPAFDTAPTGQNDWYIDRGTPRLADPGVVHSGLVAPELTGSLRSPDFTISSDSIHFRAAGRGCDVRVVVEGYTLRQYTGLLFESTLHEVNEGPGFKWYHSIKGLTKHKGRQAYIEFRDEGGGWLAVDEIRFGDGTPLKANGPGMVPDLLANGKQEKLRDLVERYTELAAPALHAWVDETATPAQIAYADFLLGNELLDLGTSEARLARFVADHQKAAKAIPDPLRALVAADGTPQQERVHVRGNYKTLGDSVPRRFLEALGGDVIAPEDNSGRLALARRIFAEDNPLPARVMVNRVWHHLFGRGIVPSVDNFGELGQAPSHPELLDHLATRFREDGWSIKGLIRDLVTTRTYRMQSTPVDKVADERDPDNVLLHRMNRRRLEGESIRDAVLAAAGTLDQSMFGPPVPAFISPYAEGNRRPEKSGPVDGDRRRSIYLEVRRNYLTPMLLAFDFPTPDTTRGRRTTSNVPAQALMLMNSPFVLDQAGALASTLIAEEDTLDKRLNRLFIRTLGRTPTEAEKTRLRDFLASQAETYDLAADEAVNDPRVWTDLCHVTFTLKEFIFLG